MKVAVLPRSEEERADELDLDLGFGHIGVGDDLAGGDQPVVDDFLRDGNVPGDIRYLDTADISRIL